MQVKPTERLMRRGSSRLSYVMMLAVDIGASEDPLQALRGLEPPLTEWVAGRGAGATHVLITIIDAAQRNEAVRDAARSVCSQVLASPLGESLRRMQNFTVAVLEPGGKPVFMEEAIESQLAERVALPPVQLPGGGIARAMGLFRGNTYEDMYVQFWTGNRWAHDPNDEELSVPVLMTFMPADRDVLLACGIPEKDIPVPPPPKRRSKKGRGQRQ